MLRQREYMIVLIGLVTLLAVNGCRRGSPNNASKTKQVRIGMTVQQVDGILGKPLKVHDMSSVRPGLQLRFYQGYTDADGFDHAVAVTFENGTVTEVDDHPVRKYY